MGLMHNGVVYALWDYSAEFGDELSFREGESVTVLRRDGPEETDWWWAALHGQEGYVPRNYFGVSPEEIYIVSASWGYLGKGIDSGKKRSKRDSPHWGQGRSEESIMGRGEIRTLQLGEKEPLPGGTLWGTHCLTSYLIGSCSVKYFLSSLVILLGRQGRMYFSQGKP